MEIDSDVIPEEQVLSSFPSDPRFLHEDIKVDNEQLSKCLRDGVELKPHQQRGASFMLHREKMYQSGGIVMDEAGLGKTVQTLAAIAANPEAGPTLVICPASIFHVWLREMKNFFQDKTFSIYKYDSGRQKRKIPKDCNIVITTYGIVAKETNQPKEGELPLSVFKETSIFHQMKFGRIILDEAHHVRNTKVLCVRPLKELCSNPSTIVWCLTATVIVNSISDLWNIVQMINLYPLCEKQVWDNVISTISSSNSSQYGIDQLKEFLYPVLIRRTKDIIPNMTDISYRDVYLDFSPQEKEFYEALFEYSKQRVEKFVQLIETIKEQNPNYNKKSLRYKERTRRLQEAKACIFSLLLRLRQACCSPNIVLRSMKRLKDIAQSDDMSKDQLVNAIERLKKIDQEKECPICFDDDVSMEVASSCLHVVCRTCWEKLRKEKRPCPICRGNFEETAPVEEQMENLKSMLDEIEKDEEEPSSKEEEPDDGFYIPSTKIEYIMKELERLLSESKNKILIVSEWKVALHYVQQEFLKRFPNIQFCTLDGRINPQQRSLIVGRFQTEKKIRVCFVSMKSASEGVTLTAANHMMFLNLGWNESDEYQMSNRIHRVGQLNNVVIQRIHIKDSVEMSMQKIRQMKKLPSEVLFGKVVLDPKKDSITGIRLIFDLRSEKPRHYLKRKGPDYEEQPANTHRNTRPKNDESKIISPQDYIDLTTDDVALPILRNVMQNPKLSLEEAERILFG